MKLLQYIVVVSLIFFNLFTSYGQEVLPDSSQMVDPAVIDSNSNTNQDTNISKKVDSASHISEEAISSMITYSCKDSFPIYMDQNQMVLKKEAKVSYENINLEAGIIRFDWKNNTVFAEGYHDSLGNYLEAPVFKDGGQVYKAHKIAYNFKTKRAKIYDLFTREGEQYIHGNEVKKDADDNLSVKDAKFTTCDQEHPHFYIGSSKIKILENQIITGPAWLVIEDIPVPLVLPFGFFPKQTKRSSGIVMPGYGNSTDRGFYLRGLGYYFAINDYFDLMLKGDIYTNGSWLLSGTTNYAKRYKYRGNLYAHFGNNRFGDPETSDFRVDRDFTIRWTHQQDAKARPNSTFSASVNAGSRNSLRNNSRDPNDILQNTLSSSVSYSKTFVGTPFSMSAGLTHNQSLSEKTISLNAPDLSVNMKRISPLKNVGKGKKRWYNNIGVSYKLNFKNTLNTTENVFLDPETWREWNNGIKHNIPLSTSFKILKHITVSPQVNYVGRTYFERMKKTYYAQHDSAEGDTIIQTFEKGVYHLNEFFVSGNISTRVYGTFNVNKFGLIAMRHVISPSVSFSYRPDFSDPKYGYYNNVQVDSTGETQTYSMFQGGNFIYGAPGSGKQGNINFSIGNNLEAKIRKEEDSTGSDTRKVKLLESLSISGSYNTLADSMKLSAITFNGWTNLFEKLNLNFSMRMDPYAITNDSLVFDKLAILNGNGLGRITSGYISLNTSLNTPKKGKGGEKTERHGYSGLPYDNYVDFDIPWNLSLSYSLNYNNYNIFNGKVIQHPQVIQTLNFSGNLSLTPKWKINFRSGYDLENGEFTFTSIDLYRDLHCWEMSFSWIPFGSRQSYYFKINVKSSTLKDLKLDKRKDFWDY